MRYLCQKCSPGYSVGTIKPDGGPVCNPPNLNSKPRIISEVILAFLFLLVLPSLCYADVASDIQTNVFPTWMPMIAVALIIGFGLAAIAYMLSAIMSLPELNAWAKNEVAEVTASGFLVAIVILAILFSDQIFIVVTGSTPMAISTTFTRDIGDKLIAVYFQGARTQAVIGMLSGMPPQYRTGAGTGGPSWKQAREKMKNAISSSLGTNAAGIPIGFLVTFLYLGDINFYSYTAADKFMFQISQMQSLALTGAGISIFLNIALKFIEEIALPVLVPLGLLLSCFSFTRKMGRTFIAFGVGLYFLFPASIIIGKMMYETAVPHAIGAPPLGISEPNLRIYGMDLDPATPLDILGVLLNPPNLGFSSYWSDVAKPEIDKCGDQFCKAGQQLFYALYYGVWLIQTILAWIVAVIQAFLNFAGWALMMMAGQAASFIPFCSICEFVAAYPLNQMLTENLADYYIAYIPYVLQYVIPVIILPVIVLIVTVTGIRAISPAIGGEVQILGVSELI